MTPYQGWYEQVLMYAGIFGFGPLSVFQHDDSGNVTQLLLAVEAGDFEDKEVAYDLALELLHEVCRRLRRAAYLSVSKKSHRSHRM